MAMSRVGFLGLRPVQRAEMSRMQEPKISGYVDACAFLVWLCKAGESRTTKPLLTSGARRSRRQYTKAIFRSLLTDR
jgi:hypothetical protein